MKRSQKTALLVLMSLILIILNADANVLAQNVGAIEKWYGGITDADIGFMMGLFTVLGALVSLVFGYLGGKGSRKWLFILAVVLGELPCALTTFAPTYAWFFILRILCGFGVGAAFPLVFSIAGDIFSDKERPLATMVLTTAYAVGNIAGTVMGGFLASTELWAGFWPGSAMVGAYGDSLGWRMTFMLAAVPNIPFLILFALMVPNPRVAASEEATRELVEAGLVYPRGVSLKSYLDLATIKTNLLLFVQGLLGTIPWGAMFFLNVFLADNKGLGNTGATTVFTIFGAGMVVGTVVGGMVGGSLAKKKASLMPLFCGVTTILGCLLTLLVILLPAGLLALCALGFTAAFFVAMTGPNMRTMLLDVNDPESRGPIFSIFNLTDSVGTGLGKWGAGILTGLFGAGAVAVARASGAGAEAIATAAASGRGLSLVVCTLFWLGCGLFLLVVTPIFPRDIGAQRGRMEVAAAAMVKKGA